MAYAGRDKSQQLVARNQGQNMREQDLFQGKSLYLSLLEK
jgi:hypothetical protein